MNTAETIKNEVEQELRWEPSVCATKIGVSVNDGVVELDGHVGSLYEKWAAERAALRVGNVTSVASEIIVDLPFESERTDEDIASVAANHLNWNLQVPDTIKLTVSKGWVTLQGTAEWQFQKEEAARVVRSLRGVKGVSDDIALKPTLSAVGVKIKIEDALKRDAQIEAKNITVEAAGNAVTLRGRVHSWREREDAEHAAFAAPGVGSVSNLLTVAF
ncbi:MAG: BON domain-containing protein [Terracidiphilus sp.]|jgi:osmotically-inducible protein OsmY